VFVEKSGECIVVSVDKVVKISRRVSDEPGVGNITLELSDTDRFEASEDNGGGGGSGEIVSVEKIGK